MNQAHALGRHWASTPITAVYCSDLKRAHSTAQALVAGQVGPGESGAEAEKGIEPIVTPLLREQHFGIVEGKPWAAAPDSSPNGQSLSE
jgi:broad specificity phosphatase PhoE